MEDIMSNAESRDQDDLTQFRRLLADEWEFRMQEDPLLATRCGDHRFGDRLTSVLPEDFKRRSDQARIFLARLLAIERDRLPLEEQLNFDIFKLEIENQIAEYEFGVHFMPVANYNWKYISLLVMAESKLKAWYGMLFTRRIQ